MTRQLLSVQVGLARKVQIQDRSILTAIHKTLAGLLENEVWVDDVLRLADCALRVVQPRVKVVLIASAKPCGSNLAT